MVTEYNKNIIMRRRMEAAEVAERLEAAEKEALNKAAKSVVKENLTTEQTAEASTETKPKKTDAEKLKKGKK